MASKYNYSLIHQQPGIPKVQNRQHHYQFANNEHDQSGNQMGSESLVTEQLLLQLTDCDSLDEIRVISLRNKQLKSCLKILSNCENLEIAYLQGNQLNLPDLMYLSNFKNIKKIDLSHNQISVLPGPEVFSNLLSLKFLYLHNNNITDWSNLQSLCNIPSIFHLTLFSNPVCTIPGYRHFIVNSSQSLLALDNFVITDEERIEDASFGYRFRGLNEFMKLHIPDYAKEKSAEQHLFNLEVDIYRLKRIFERNSPSILIQSVYRGYRQRNFIKVYFNERKKKIIKIQKVIRGWLMRKKFKKDLRDMLRYTQQEHLLMTNAEIRRRNAANLIKKYMVRFHREKKRQLLELKSSLKIQKFYRGRFIKNTSFIHALDLVKHPRIYFLKEQKPVFINILKQLLPLFEQTHQYRFDQLVQLIKEDTKYDTIRVAEPDLFNFKNLPLVQFVKPSIISRVRFSKASPLENQRLKNFTLTEFYFSRNKFETDKKLKIIKKRNCYLRKEKIANLYSKMKKNPFKNQFVFQDQYRDLMVFESPKLDLLITLCFAVLDYNRQQATDQESQFLTFYDPLLSKVSSATRIQQAFRAYRFRKYLHKLPIQNIIERRAAFCIQRWWSNLKLRMRMIALSKIKKHIDRIRSPEVYIEQSLYSNLNSIAFQVHNQLKFEEQQMSFDFSLNHFQIYMVVQEKEKPIFRYIQTSVPKWFNLNLRVPEFAPTPYVNNILAFFHYNDEGCSIVPANYVLKAEKNQLDVDRQLYFLKMRCFSVEEAKRRATALAILTYDVHKHLFAQLSTSEMLEDPFLISNIYEMQKRFRIKDIETTTMQNQTNLVDVKNNFYLQNKQNHHGLLLSDQDQRSLVRSGLNYKKLKLEKRVITVTCNGLNESESMDKELMLRESRSEIDLSKQDPQISFFENRKIQEQQQTMMKEKRLMIIRDTTQAFRQQNTYQKQLLQEQFDLYLQAKKEEVNKVREISKIIHNEQKGELDKNLSIFLTLNKEEKALRKELTEKQMEVEYKEKFLKKVNVLQQHKNRQIKKEEQEKFINSFSQAKNLIDKQIRIGKKIKENKMLKKANQAKVQAVKDSQGQAKQAIKSVLFDNSYDLDRVGGSQQRFMTGESRAVISSQHSQKNYDMKGNSIQKVHYTTAITQGDETNISSRKIMKSAHRIAPSDLNRSYFLPPLQGSSFSDQFQSIKNQGINETFHSQPFDQEMAKEIEEIYRSTRRRVGNKLVGGQTYNKDYNF